ncbi:hypothetical protein F5146DRAFT_195430 [Armillaria mellea]|nr:hypothetical protein F5146DRAFT_195430 [Armillaria mellea]
MMKGLCQPGKMWMTSWVHTRRPHWHTGIRPHANTMDSSRMTRHLSWSMHHALQGNCRLVFLRLDKSTHTRQSNRSFACLRMMHYHWESRWGVWNMVTGLTLPVPYVSEFHPSSLELIVIPRTGPGRHSRTYGIQKLQDQSDVDGLLTMPGYP